MSKISNFLQKKAIQDGVRNMQKAPLDVQLDFLKRGGSDLLRRAIEQKAPDEMHKGAMRLHKEGKPVTVDNLLEEYRREIKFKRLAEDAGLGEEWFIALAKKECEDWI